MKQRNMKRKTHRQRLLLVIDYIHDNLDSDLDVNTLAGVAMMSPYHFHRIYRELTHETVNATVRRLRLQRAAVDLIRSQQSLSEIARKVSYGSVESFSRAFTKQFGQSPRDYRKSKRGEESLYEARLVSMPLDDAKSYNDLFEVKVVNLDAMDAAFYDHRGDYLEIGAVFDRLLFYMEGQNILNQGMRFFGFYYDDPESVGLVDLRSKACATIPVDADLEGDDAPDEVLIPKGRYATLLFKGSYAELDGPRNWLFGKWLPNSGYEAANFPIVEEYLNSPKEMPPSELLTRIYCLLA